MGRPQAESGDMECGGPPPQMERQKSKGRLFIALLIHYHA